MFSSAIKKTQTAVLPLVGRITLISHLLHFLSLKFISSLVKIYLTKRYTRRVMCIYFPPTLFLWLLGFTLKIMCQDLKSENIRTQLSIIAIMCNTNSMENK